jgi:hypothetical protein
MFYDIESGPELTLNDIIVGYNDEITDLKFCKRRKKMDKFNLD